MSDLNPTLIRMIILGLSTTLTTGCFNSEIEKKPEAVKIEPTPVVDPKNDLKQKVEDLTLVNKKQGEKIGDLKKRVVELQDENRSLGDQIRELQKGNRLDEQDSRENEAGLAGDPGELPAVDPGSNDDFADPIETAQTPFYDSADSESRPDSGGSTGSLSSVSPAGPDNSTPSSDLAQKNKMLISSVKTTPRGGAAIIEKDDTKNVRRVIEFTVESKLMMDYRVKLRIPYEDDPQHLDEITYLMIRCQEINATEQCTAYDWAYKGQTFETMSEIEGITVTTQVFSENEVTIRIEDPEMMESAVREDEGGNTFEYTLTEMASAMAAVQGFTQGQNGVINGDWKYEMPSQRE